MSDHRGAQSIHALRARNSGTEDPRGVWAPTATFEVLHRPTRRPLDQAGVFHHGPTFAKNSSHEGLRGARAAHVGLGPAKWARCPPRPTFGPGEVRTHPLPPESGSALACPLHPSCVRLRPLASPGRWTRKMGRLLRAGYGPVLSPKIVGNFLCWPVTAPGCRFL
jgi:hypothetical protein